MAKQIYVDEIGLQQLDEEIKKIEKDIKANALAKREAALDACGNGTQDSFDFEEASRNDMFLRARLVEAKERRNRAVLLTRENNEEIVDIGDYVKISLEFDGDSVEEIIQLSGVQNYDLNKTINEISINSPIGKTIYKQNVGFKGTYTVEESEFQVTILSKLTKEEAYNELGIKLLEKK